MSAQGLASAETSLISLNEVRRFIIECLQAVGTPYAYAAAQADLLVEADYRGHYSHGMNRLHMYVRDIKNKTCNITSYPKVLQETPATAWVDGQNCLGAVVGNFCMDLAIKKAQDVGVGWVCAKESSHYGIAGIYALQAIKQGLLGMSFTNGSKVMCPTRSKESGLGANPLSLGAPANNGDNFVLDMSTTTVAVGKIEIQKRKKAPIPEGWALDSEGNVTTNADEAYNSKRLIPLGGAEINSGYKGFGLGMMVEIFCGILSGSSYGENIPDWSSSSEKANLGQCFVAINPKCFAPGFEDRMSDLMNTIRNLEPVDPNQPVLVAGDTERNHMKSVDDAGGIQYLKNQMDTCEELAEGLNVKPLQTVQ